MQSLDSVDRIKSFGIFSGPILRFQVSSTDAWPAHGARAYNGSLGAEPPAGSRGRASGQGGGRSPTEAESFITFQHEMKAAKFTAFTVCI